jgi:hypothetical protein
MGLVIRKVHAAPARAVLVDALKRETSPHVRVVLAEALSHVGETALALTTFREALASGAEPIALQALNAMTYVDPACRPLDAIARWDKHPGYLGRATRYLIRTATGGFDPSISLLGPRR